MQIETITPLVKYISSTIDNNLPEALQDAHYHIQVLRTIAFDLFVGQRCRGCEHWVAGKRKLDDCSKYLCGLMGARSSNMVLYSPCSVQSWVEESSWSTISVCKPASPWHCLSSFLRQCSVCSAPQLKTAFFPQLVPRSHFIRSCSFRPCTHLAKTQLLTLFHMQ